MSKKYKRVLVLGGTGLVGEEIVKRFADQAKEIVIVSLGADSDRKSFENLKSQFPNLSHITGNIFLSSKYKDKTFNELIESEIFLDEYLDQIYLNPEANTYFLYDVIQKTKPDIIIDAINSATVLSYTKGLTLIQNYLNGDVLKEKTLLATLSLPRLINFFNCLYRSLQEAKSVKTYLKIGTTGTGGMGFNIPYTHGENKPSFSLLEKAAVSGAFTSLLFLLAQTFDMPVIKEIKPAALVGYKKVGKGRISLGRNSSEALKVYELSSLTRIDLLKEQEINFQDLSNKGSRDLEIVFVDTGENGQFSTEEFRAISHEAQMGLVTKEEIADVVVQEIDGKETKHEVIRAFRESVLGPSAFGQEIRNKVLNEMSKLKNNDQFPSIALEVLGPPRLSKLLLEAFIIKEITNFEQSKIEKLNLNQEDLDERFVVLATSIGIPILFANQILLVGRKPKVPEYKQSVNEENINFWAKTGWVDLRKSNLLKWKERISNYKKESKELMLGDIVAWIFEHEDKAFRKRSTD